jgi:hypothetical protein
MAKDITVDQRRVLKKHAVVTVTVIESAKHKALKRIGTWIVKLGLLIMGIGEVRIE